MKVEHTSDWGEAYHSLGRRRQLFEIFGEPAAPPEPCKSPFDFPSVLQDSKGSVGRSVDQFKSPAFGKKKPIAELGAVYTIRPIGNYSAEARKS